jgi:hypothetical protein
MSENLAYLNYWKRKELMSSQLPTFPVSYWWMSEELSDSEVVIFNKIKTNTAILDVGAGDFRVKKKFCKHGFQGDYHTQDIGTEFDYTYKTLAQVSRQYPAILYLDVLEHLSLEDGLGTLHKLFNLLEPNGHLVIQTPNARCVRSPLISDMTHLHCYNLPDLWSYLTALGCHVDGYRIVLGKPVEGILPKLKSNITRYITTRLMGLDYADNILLIAQKQAS